MTYCKQAAALSAKPSMSSGVMFASFAMLTKERPINRASVGATVASKGSLNLRFFIGVDLPFLRNTVTESRLISITRGSSGGAIKCQMSGAQNRINDTTWGHAVAQKTTFMIEVTLDITTRAGAMETFVCRP